MQLTLKYNEHATHVLSGAFIRGNTPGEWLQEINAWQIPLEKLVCFIIAQNNNPANAAGLFVIFSKDQMPGTLLVRHPYTVLGKKLFIPVNAELSPAISEQELQSLLIWDCQVFHPTIGFIGFERSDRINLGGLLQYKEPRSVYWGYAQPGLQPWIPLRQIGVQQMTAQDVLASFKEHVSNKPLEEIPKSNKKEVPAWLNNPIAGGLFKGVFTFINGVSSIIPAGLLGSPTSNEGGNNGQSAENDKKPGLFKKIMNWMEQKIEDLEKQRDSELKRLSEMFDKDTDEALQYAIPLSSPYLGRGTAQPSGQLGKRSTQFNLGRLGGGQAVDGWNVDNYYNDLRTKYLKAAQKAIEEKDFKKAAYIYAHLLGDFTSAAATLRQSKHYREAAVLYQEHLKNPTMAATCYEEGGLLMEAIEIYTGLNQHEKAGDLYQELGQQEPALDCYEKCVVAATANKDYLEESRIIIDKIGDKPRAKQVLLSGWHDVKQPEACLVKYFDLVADNNKEQMHSVVKTFYADNQVANKEMAFLNVIDKVNRKYKTTELESTCQGIAYEIVSEQVSAGNPDSLFTLRNFVPDDKLLTPDFYRFMHAVKDAPIQKPASDQWQLMKDVSWEKVFMWRNQILVSGMKLSGLVLARMNWEGHVEYVTWNVIIKSGIPLLPIANPAFSNYIVMYVYNESLTNKSLPKNKYFEDELIVFHPDFLGTNAIGIGRLNADIIVLSQENGNGLLSYYTLGGNIKASYPCSFNDGSYNITFPPVVASEMIFCADKYYLAFGDMVLRISKVGAIDVVYQALAPIRKMVVRELNREFVAVGIAFDEQVEVLITNDNGYFDKPGETIKIKAVDLTFMPNGSLVVAGEKEVQVFNGETYEFQWQIETKNHIIAVFPGPTREQLGILESNGKITLHTIKE